MVLRLYSVNVQCAIICSFTCICKLDKTNTSKNNQVPLFESEYLHTNICKNKIKRIELVYKNRLGSETHKICKNGGNICVLKFDK